MKETIKTLETMQDLLLTLENRTKEIETMSELLFRMDVQEHPENYGLI